jgi:hypothetical protein
MSEGLQYQSTKEFLFHRFSEQYIFLINQPVLHFEISSIAHKKCVYIFLFWGVDIVFFLLACHLQSPRSLLSDRSHSRSPRLNSTVNRRRPSFNVSSFGSLLLVCIAILFFTILYLL